MSAFLADFLCGSLLGKKVDLFLHKGLFNPMFAHLVSCLISLSWWSSCDATSREFYRKLLLTYWVNFQLNCFPHLITAWRLFLQNNNRERERNLGKLIKLKFSFSFCKLLWVDRSFLFFLKKVNQHREITHVHKLKLRNCKL